MHCRLTHYPTCAAGADFADAILRALNGEKNVTVCTYVESPLYQDKGVTFFSSPVTLDVSPRPLVPTLYASEVSLTRSILPG